MTPLDTQTFETLLANCADEQIRFPGAIQPHGLLLTLSEPDLHIQQISANVENLFGLAPAALLDQPLATLTGPHASTIVEQAAQFAGQVDVPPL